MTESSQQLRSQYRTDRNLNARIALHADYSTNPYGWSRWVFDRIDLPASARIVELGCGPASLWTGNDYRIGAGILMTPTVFSLPIDIKPMGRMLNHADPVSSVF